MTERTKEFSGAKFADVKPKMYHLLETCPFKSMKVGDELIKELHAETGACPFSSCQTMGEVKERLRAIAEKNETLKTEVEDLLSNIEVIYKEVSDRKDAQCPYFKHGNPLKD